VTTSTPVLIPSFTNVVQVSAGESHSLFRLSDGSVYSTGLNTNGQLGLNNNIAQTSPIKITILITNTTQISTGPFHSLCLSNTGNVYSFGQNLVTIVFINCTSIRSLEPEIKWIN
jgi:alpha-tubulin suppressor-like RCC1 family protein